MHTYSIHIYLYHNLRNQNVEFPIKSLFFNNHLFLNVIKTIILYNYYRALWEDWEREGEDALGVLFLLFLQGFIFGCFSLVGHFCTAGICAEPYSGKNNDM